MKRIFLIEDSNLVLNLLKFSLENEFQCDVICFSEPREMIAQLNLKPDLIILDYYLDHTSNMDGMQVLQKIKKYCPSVPVVMFSGQHNLQTALKLIQIGAVDYIDKNEDSFLEDILNSVRNIFQYQDTEKALGNSQVKLTLNRRQLVGFGFASILILIALMTI